MRQPNYLSFSALKVYEDKVDEYVLRYLTDLKPPREMQGQAAGVGSAFDARVKSHMYSVIYGPNYKPDVYSYEALFEKQVEPQNRDFCAPAGDHVFECYKVAGFLDMLQALAARAIEPPQFEFQIEREVGGVPLLGKPDGYIIVATPEGGVLKIVLDFKVNGYCSRSAVSPNQGFILCRDGFVATKQSLSHNTIHKNADVRDYKGVTIGGYLEDASEDWASQLIGYAWCLGAEVGSEDTVLMIHQCVAKPIPDGRPNLRFAAFSGPVRKPFQEHLVRRYQTLWNAIKNNHIFTDLSKEESIKRFDLLNAQAKVMVESDPDDIFMQVIRPTWRG